MLSAMSNSTVKAHDSLLSAILRDWRGKRPQSSVARFIGVPVKTFQNWEQGVRIPRGLALAALREKIRRKP